MKRKLRLTASACLLGCLVLLNACNDVKPSVDSDPVDTGTYSQESEDTDISKPANTTDTSHELPRGEIPFESVYIMGTYPDSDNPDLPDNIRYLDDTRNLKDTYTLDEAVSRYAIRLYYSTIICNGCEDYIMTHSFYCTDYGNNYYNCHNTVFLKEPKYLSDDLVLQDTTFTSLAEFKRQLEDTGYVCIEDARVRQYSEDLDSATIIEQTDEYVFASVQTKNYSYSYSDIHYQYYFAEVIGGRVYLTWFRSYNNNGTDPLTDDGLNEFKKFSLLVFSHLEKDDGKEPYIYDKFVNISWFGNSQLRSFNDIEQINTSNDTYHIPGYESAFNASNISFLSKELGYVNISIDPPEDNELDVTPWEDIGDMKTRLVGYGNTKNTRQILFTKNGIKYLISFKVEEYDGTLESSDAFIGYLKSKKALI